MSLALYRTYRPSSLGEVIGQSHVTEPLSRALDNNRVHHAYLFSGPRGCGKTSTARILARSLLCERGPTSTPCGTCQFCVGLAATGPGLVDVIELDAASHGGVDDTRDLRERAAFVPAEARYKVYIIDEAHMVTKDGFNALLKLIEEPPEHLKFIFATTELDKVLPTIRSRTFNYSFRLVPVAALQANLAGICEAEKVPFEPSALTLVARASGGSVRDAQSILGQLIAGADKEGLVTSQVAEQLGATDIALLDQLMAALTAADGPGVFAVAAQVVDSGHDIRRFVTDLLHHLRNLTLLTHTRGQAAAETLEVSPDRKEVLVEQAKALSAAELARMIEVVNWGLTQLKGSTAPRLQLEILLAKLLIPAADSDPTALNARIDELERRLAALSHGQTARTGPTAPPAAEPAQAQPAAAESEQAPTRQAAQPPPPPAQSAGAAPEPKSGPPPRAPRRLQTGERPASPRPAPKRPPVEESAAAKTPTPNSAATEQPAANSGRRSDPSLSAIRELWPQLLVAVREQSRVAGAVWDGADPVSVDDGTLTVHVPTDGQVASIQGSRRDVQLRNIMIDRFRVDVQINVVAAGSPGGDAGPSIADEPADDDPDASQGLEGEELVKQKLGAVRIGESEG